MALKRIIDDDTVLLQENGSTVLSIQEIVENKNVLVKLSGTLRSDTTHDLKDELMALTTLGMNLTVDLAGVEHISAASQHVLLDVQKKMDTLGRGTLLLQQLSQTIMDEFEKTGLSELLDIE